MTVPIVLVCASLAVACREDAGTARGAERPAPIAIGPEDFTIVREGELERGPLISGRLRPEQRADVRAQLSGSVLEVHAEPGERVVAGEVLARLDGAALRDRVLSARSAVSSAETALGLARSDAERLAKMWKAGAVSEQQAENARNAVEAARAQLADARAQLASAQEQMAYTIVRAPLSGTVSERSVHAGDIVQTGQALFTIVDPSSMRLEGTIPAAQLSEVQVGDPVKFQVTGYQDTFAGRVTRISPVADPATGQIRVFVSIPNDGNALVGGLFTRGRIGVERATGPVAPASAVREHEGQTTMAVVRAGEVQQVPVEVGLRDPLTEQVLVRAGVRPGEIVLLGAAQALTAGTEVRVANDPSTAQRR